MTDLVQKLVVALEGLDEAYCRAGSPLTREERAEDRKRLIAARAVLSEAKAGGWVAVPVEPTDEMLAAGKKQAHSNNSVGAKCLRIYAAMLAARPLPAPPAQKDNT